MYKYEYSQVLTDAELLGEMCEPVEVFIGLYLKKRICYFQITWAMWPGLFIYHSSIHSFNHSTVA